VQVNLERLKNKFIDAALGGLMIVILPTLIVSTLRFLQTGWRWVYLFQFLLVVCLFVLFAFRSKLSANFKTHFLNSLFLASGIAGTIFFSLSGAVYYGIIIVTNKYSYNKPSYRIFLFWYFNFNTAYYCPFTVKSFIATKCQL
jgi:hypothetical protein